MSTIYRAPVRTRVINHPSPASRVGEGGRPQGVRGRGKHSLPFVSPAQHSLEGLLLQGGSLDLPIDSSLTLLPPPQPGQGPHQWSWEGGEEAGRSLAEAAAAAARRGRGGAAPPPLSPNRVTGGAARVSLRTEKCGPNSQDRSAHHSPGLPGASSMEAQPRSFYPKGALPRPSPTTPALGPHTHHPARPSGTSTPRRGGRRPLPTRDLRRVASAAPPRPPPGGGSGEAAAVTRRPRGRKLRPPPAPPAAALPRPGTKETKPRRPGPAPLLPPLRPPGRPPPARRPSQAGSSQESGARGRKRPGTPHSSPSVFALAQGGGLDPLRRGG